MKVLFKLLWILLIAGILEACNASGRLEYALECAATNKGELEKVLEYYHLNQSEAMAFGDGNNDIEMFQAVGKGIAMANASDRLKEAAYGLCGDAAEDGIYHYCMEHGLI